MRRRSKGALVFVAAVLAFGGCEKRAQEVKAPATATAPDQEIAATVDGVPISAGELDASAGGQLQKLMAQIYQVKKGALEGMIADRLIEKAAKQQGVSKEEYIAQNVDAKAPAPTEEEIRAFYDQQQGRMQAPFEQMKERIADYLKRARRNEQMQALVARLKGEADIKVLLEPPRTEVSLENAAYTSGDESAKITMVEFSDYQCPYSQQAQATVRRVLNEYQGKIHYAFFDFPLSFHQNAMKAHEAARCAGEQGKYAYYNRKLFENQARLAVEDLKKYAKDLGLDTQAFDSCLDTGKSGAAVQQSIQKGNGVGVSGTPAFFVNGILISGAQPFESFQETIRAELER